MDRGIVRHLAMVCCFIRSLTPPARRRWELGIGSGDDVLGAPVSELLRTALKARLLNGQTSLPLLVPEYDGST